MTTFLILVLLLTFLLMGIPIAFALGGLGLILLVAEGFNPIMGLGNLLPLPFVDGGRALRIFANRRPR